MNPKMTKCSRPLPSLLLLSSLQPKENKWQAKSYMAAKFAGQGGFCRFPWDQSLHSSSSRAGNNLELGAPSDSKAEEEPTTDVLTPLQGVSPPLILALKL